MTEKNQMTVGVIIARFQVPELHAGHTHLIEYVMERHERLIVLLGDRTIQANERHPLDFETRKLMVLGAYPTAEVYRLLDRGNDVSWSSEVDLVLGANNAHGALLYGSRDSFIPYYKGVHQCVEVPTLGDHSGTALRENGCHPIDSVDFRRGMIYRTKKRYPQGHPTVDMALIRKVGDEWQVLLGKRSPTDVWWRFPGGFFDPALDESYEDAAARELGEETSVAVRATSAIYLGSCKVDDWRYADSKDRIVTTLFAFIDFGSTPAPADDLGEVGWRPLASLMKEIWPGHAPLAEMLMKYLSIR